MGRDTTHPFKKSLVLPGREALPAGSEAQLLFISVFYQTPMVCKGSRLTYKGHKSLVDRSGQIYVGASGKALPG